MVIPEISFIHSSLFGNLGGGMYPGISIVSILYKNRKTQTSVKTKGYLLADVAENPEAEPSSGTV